MPGLFFRGPRRQQNHGGLGFAEGGEVFQQLEAVAVGDGGLGEHQGDVGVLRDLLASRPSAGRGQHLICVRTQDSTQHLPEHQGFSDHEQLRESGHHRGPPEDPQLPARLALRIQARVQLLR
jgi:hypothetical protein